MGYRRTSTRLRDNSGCRRIVKTERDWYRYRELYEFGWIGPCRPKGGLHLYAMECAVLKYPLSIVCGVDEVHFVHLSGERYNCRCRGGSFSYRCTTCTTLN
jgi:hypothetical protein